MFFLGKGYRVIAHDRRGHGRFDPTIPWSRHGHLRGRCRRNLRKRLISKERCISATQPVAEKWVRVMSPSTAKASVAKAVLISAIPACVAETDTNPEGVPKEVFDGLRDGTGNHRSQFYKEITMPFYGFNRAGGAAISEGIRENWWRQGMMGAIKAQYDCVPKSSRRPNSSTTSK